MKVPKRWFDGFGRQQTASPSGSGLHPIDFPPHARCGAGCDNRTGYQCMYRDAAGNHCGWWCEEHSVVSGDQAWCRRHANSMKWVKAREGSILEIAGLPGMNDRSPNLAGMLVDELNDEVVAYLRSTFGRVSGIQIVTDDGIRSGSVPKGRVEVTPDGPIVLNQGAYTSWARGWAVYSEVGYVIRIVLQVTAAEPPMVYVYVNGSPVLGRIPDWIASRDDHSDPAAERATFRRLLLDSIRKGVEGRIEILDMDALAAGKRY
ncbi:MAG TPA: hypothetical protein VET26_09975 [Candidatus Sulfotelmatobacter sp.]|nr:hypothetical protein [Candidatus Sulfotelmatobacter sp.]